MPDYARMLGNVKPHVRTNGVGIATKYNLAVIGGYRSRGSVPNSDHPRGLAIDFMCSIPVGERIVKDMLANWRAYNVKYIIHNRRIWNDPTSSQPYNGPSPHTDHVHVSYTDTPGSSQGSVGGAVGGGVENAPTEGGLLDPILAPFRAISAALEFLTDPVNWLRMGIALAGGLMLLFGLSAILRSEQIIDLRKVLPNAR